ncbi:hypothetical protein PR202_ga23318 [Eleusine coracana subsp. coracana]|uniref:Uncharacterized protein n=1 Tax=Eleusine coracana subsp. coracana TaxID=191504 RepID=A0AAV5D3Y6_ELECO|nr:hypothetical protein PR202_ga23318 [Eleusine coracana subsp. coracana]
MAPLHRILCSFVKELRQILTQCSRRAFTRRFPLLPPPTKATRAKKRKAIGAGDCRPTKHCHDHVPGDGSSAAALACSFITASLTLDLAVVVATTAEA